MNKLNKILAALLLTGAALTIGYTAKAQVVNSADLFRLFNPRTGDHFYTTSLAERDNAIRNLGYRSEGILGSVLTESATSTAPFFRLFNPNTIDHFYTTSVAERNAALALGYRNEGNVGFVFTEQVGDAMPIFRLFNPQSGDHFYTTDLNERVRADQVNYTFEGIAGYIQDRLFNQIRVNNPQPNQTVTSPLTATGHARGNWFFEGSFPITLFDELGRQLAQSIAQAQGDAMTTNFVPFTSTPLNFVVPGDVDEGFLYFEKDNPSGLPQFNDELIVPVDF